MYTCEYDDDDGEAIDIDSLDADQLRELVRELSESARAVLDAHDELAVEHQSLQEQYDKVLEVAEEGAAREEELFALQARGGFDAVAKELGVRPGLVEGLWRAGQYEGDVRDAGAIRSHFESFLKTNPDYLSVSDKPAKLAKDANAGRGPGAPEVSGRLQVTRQQLIDPIFTSKHVKQLASGDFDIVNPSMSP
jgi:hypothetical protein